VRTVTSLLVIALLTPCFAADPFASEKERQEQMAGLRTEAEPYLAFGDETLALLSKGDGKAVKQRMSPIAVKRNGDAKVDEFVATKLVPFFANYDKVDPEMTVVRRTGDGAGRNGFVIQYGFIEKDGTHRAVVMYILKENDALVLENIVPGRTIEEASRVRRSKQ
jgi:hypothetical protein